MTCGSFLSNDILRHHILRHHVLRHAATVAALAIMVSAAPALAQDRARTPDLSRCGVQPELARLERPLRHLALRLSGGLPIKIVAVGSSSTLGFGASSPANTYPSRLEGELKGSFPDRPLTVVNRGVNGEEAPNMLARFRTAVIAEQPHLVIWQIGTNLLFSNGPFDMRRQIADGIARIRAIGADVVLMDPQYAPLVQARPGRRAVLASIARAASEYQVGLLRRYDIMRHWHEVDGLPAWTFTIWDGLHMNDWGYACLARSVARAITDAATRPTETAAIRAKGR
jgi:lysophospholipase L1-like esterase